MLFENTQAQAEKDSRLKKFISNEKTSYVKLMFVGDIPMNKRLLESAYRSENHSYDFQPIFHYIRPYLNLGHIVAGNLETTIGTPPYGRFPQYRSPKEIATSLKYTGFNLLFTANKKATYQDNETWQTQHDLLQKVKINTTGSFSSEKDKKQNNPIIIERKGVKIAYLNYLDGVELPTDVTPIINGVDTTSIRKDIKKAEKQGADFVVIYINWGEEFERKSNARQQILANFLAKAGADLVIGTHSHVVQEMDIKENINKDGSLRQTLILYSLGDFITTANSTAVNSSCIFELVLSKDKQSHKISVADFGYIPTYCYSYNYKGKLTWSIVPVRQLELENISIQFMSGEERQKMMASAENIRHKFSPYMQEIEYKLTDEIINDVAESLTVTKKPMNEREEVGLEKINLLHESYGFGRVLDTEKKLDPNKPIYRVQFMASRKRKDVDIRFYRHLKGYDILKEGAEYKYLIGNSNEVETINEFCAKIRKLGHPKALVVVYKNGKRISGN